MTCIPRGLGEEGGGGDSGKDVEHLWQMKHNDWRTVDSHSHKLYFCKKYILRGPSISKCWITKKKHPMKIHFSSNMEELKEENIFFGSSPWMPI